MFDSRKTVNVTKATRFYLDNCNVFNVLVKANEVELRCVCHDNFKLFVYKHKLRSEIHVDCGEVLSVELLLTPLAIYGSIL